MSGPLDGIRVLEVAMYGFVPSAGAVLREWGADVVKVEHAVTGDPQRGLRQTGLLRVEGDSMIEDGILDGDLVGVHRARDARDGQTVVARLDDAITIKRLEHRDGGIRLLPRNPAHAPIVIAADADFAIEGLYCGLVRQG